MFAVTKQKNQHTLQFYTNRKCFQTLEWHCQLNFTKRELNIFPKIYKIFLEFFHHYMQFTVNFSSCEQVPSFFSALHCGTTVSINSIIKIWKMQRVRCILTDMSILDFVTFQKTWLVIKKNSWCVCFGLSLFGCSTDLFPAQWLNLHHMCRTFIVLSLNAHSADSLPLPLIHTRRHKQTRKQRNCEKILRNPWPHLSSCGR